jgi:hypothetical protein
MESQDSLLCSQGPAKRRLIREPKESKPWRSKRSPLSGFKIKPPCKFLVFPHVLHDPPDHPHSNYRDHYKFRSS